ncbi:MAG: hypothetical protein CMC86_03205 [Flavobacteriaceae bacterium]|nr:hypothetical protein [Flavobacteriaceae bacterium]|tara:strand:- start:49035 stop:49508 length:474 start_codon:yes stop_codon:yes gene_type:complete
MGIHKLALDDFQDVDYQLLAIHSDLEDYRLAHAVNLHLKTRLRRKKLDIDFNDQQEAVFPLFEWKDSSMETMWNLIRNNSQIESKVLGEGLFSNENQKNIKTVSFLEEHSSAGYLLKISGGRKESEILLNLNKIPQIKMVYEINVRELKTKEYLILS